VKLVNIISLAWRCRSKFIQRRSGLPKATQKTLRYQKLCVGNRKH